MFPVATSHIDGGDTGLGSSIHFEVGDLASGDLFQRSPISMYAGRLLLVRWDTGQIEAARAVFRAAIAAAPAGTELHLTANREVHPDIDERLALADEFGFEIWQEKQGFWWSDTGQDLPAPERVTIRTLADIGRDAYVAAMADAAIDSLDVVQAHGVAAVGATRWADEFITEYSDPGGAVEWLVAEDHHGEPVGFVALGAFDEDAAGTIYHIGVCADRRGQGYIDELMRAVNVRARERGFTGMLNEVDATNAPMAAAMQRHGHIPNVRPWYRWYLRRLGPVPDQRGTHARERDHDQERRA